MNSAQTIFIARKRSVGLNELVSSGVELGLSLVTAAQSPFASPRSGPDELSSRTEQEEAAAAAAAAAREKLVAIDEAATPDLGKGPEPASLPVPPKKLMRHRLSEQNKLQLQTALEAMEAGVLEAQRELARNHCSEEAPPSPGSARRSLRRRSSTHEHEHILQSACASTDSELAAAQSQLSHCPSSGWLVVKRALEISRRTDSRPKLTRRRARRGSLPRHEEAQEAACSHAEAGGSQRRSDPVAAEARLKRFRQSLDEASSPRTGRLLDEPTHRLIDWGGRTLKSPTGRAGARDSAACTAERSLKQSASLNGFEPCVVERCGKYAGDTINLNSILGDSMPHSPPPRNHQGQLHAELLGL